MRGLLDRVPRDCSYQEEPGGVGRRVNSSPRGMTGGLRVLGGAQRTRMLGTDKSGTNYVDTFL